MTHEFHWGFLIVNYLFLAGLSAGAFATSGLANYLGGEKYKCIARIGAFVAPFPVSIGTALLLLDLGNPLRFWRLFATIQWTSPMSIGTWLLTFFIFTSLAYFILWLPDSIRNIIRLPHRVGHAFSPSNWAPLTPEQVRKGKLILGALGFPIAVGVGMYTGILLGAVPARPFWNTPMVAQLFLFSAMSTGVATVMFIRSLVKKHEIIAEEAKLLNSLDAVLIIFEIFLIIPYILHQNLSTWSHREAVKLIMGGQFTVHFWLGVIVIGLLTPLFIEVYELWHIVVKKHLAKHRFNLGLISGGLVIIGGFILRYVFVYAGQVSHFLPY